VIAKAEWTGGEANPRFIVTSLKAGAWSARPLYEEFYCARGEMENRIKEAQGDLFADRTSTATMRANQLRLWFSSMAYVLLCALRRIGLAHTQFASATCGTIRLKLLKLGALVKISARRVKIAFASACPWAAEWVITHPDFGVEISGFQAKALRIVWKGFAPLRPAVSIVVRTSASAFAAHMAR
jgi:hypothetical protein